MRDDAELPSGWHWGLLGELLTGIETGKSFKCDERPPAAEEVGVVKVSAVSWGSYREQESKTCLDPARVNASLFIAPGDFLFSRANTVELVGACVIASHVKHRIMLSDKILRLIFVDDAWKPWVLHWLRSQGGRRQIEELASGNQESMRNIGQESLRQIRVPLPPAAERSRILYSSDELLSDLNAGVAELKAAQKKLAQYRQSLLKAAVEGALTAEWRATNTPTESGAQLLERILTERRARWEAKQLAKFKEQGKAPPKDWQRNYPEPVQPDTTGMPVLPKQWTYASLDQLLVQLRSGSAETSTRDRTDFPVLKSSAVRPGSIDYAALNYLDATQSRAENYLESGDLLINRLSGSVEYVGCCAQVGDLPLRAVQYPDRIFCGRLANDTPVLGRHIVNCVSGPHVRARVEQAAKSTAGHKRISMGDLHPLPIPVPPLGEMQVVAQLMETALEQFAQQQTVIDRALRQSAAQRQNILRAAFTGQLVPQDPNDEPASVLLERIRADRAAQAAVKTPRARRIKEAA